MENHSDVAAGATGFGVSMELLKDAWPYAMGVVTFLVGGGLGTYLGYVISPKAERERLQFEREKWEADRKEHVRQRWLADLDALADMLEEAHRMQETYHRVLFGPDDDEVDSEEFKKAAGQLRERATTATLKVVGQPYLTREASWELLHTMGAIYDWCQFRERGATASDEEESKLGDDFAMGVIKSRESVRRLFESL